MRQKEDLLRQARWEPDLDELIPEGNLNITSRLAGQETSIPGSVTEHACFLDNKTIADTNYSRISKVKDTAV